MRVKDMVKKLKGFDSRFRFIPGPLKASGLYLKDQRHPDSNEAGLRWVAALPSPSFFSGNMKKEDFYFDKDKGPEGKGEYMRGWHTVIRMLVGNRTLTRVRAKMLFGSSWCR